MMYRRAEEFFARGQYQLAAEEYARLVERYPHSGTADAALYKVGHLYSVHLGNPQKAVEAYNRLVERYPRSPYASSALLAVIRLSAAQLGDPAAAERALRQLEESHPERPALIARARVELARAYLQAGDVQKAMRHAQAVWTQYRGQPEQAASAGLLLAELAQRQGDPKTAADLLEAIPTKYPQTLAAAEARKMLGLLYYARSKEEDRKRREEMRKEKRWLDGLGAFGNYRTPRLNMLDALRALLRYHGLQVTLPLVAALSGKGLMPDAELRGSGQVWDSDPLVSVVEACGLSVSVWNATSKQEAWEAVRRAIVGGRPALVVFSPGTPWVLVGGWNPEIGQVGLLRPGDGKLHAMRLEEFLNRWRPAAQAVSEVRFPPGTYYVLAISGRRRPVDATQLEEAALRQLAAAARELRASGTPAVQAARQVAETVSGAVVAGRVPAEIVHWADIKLPRWAEIRRISADFLGSTDPQLAEQARHVADVAGALRSALLTGARGAATEHDLRVAASFADRLAVEEDNFLSALEKLSTSEGGS